MKIVRVAALFCAVAGMLELSGGPSSAAGFPAKLYLSQDGLALSQFPSRQVLKRTIKITRTRGKGAANWTAGSDQSWLSVTPSGKTGGKLTVIANPQGLAEDQFYLANVTVATEAADLTDSETLRVGLWVGSGGPANNIFLTGVGVNIATNPVLPLVYAVMIDGKSIGAFNVYTGALVASYSKVGIALGDLEVSSDGTTLFAADRARLKILAIDAQSGAVLHTYDMPDYSQDEAFTFAYARPYGQPALYIPGSPEGCGCNYGQIIAYPSGQKLGGGFGYNLLTVTPDGTTALTMVPRIDPGSYHSYEIKLTADGLGVTEMDWNRTQGLNCQDFAISQDGKHAYMSCGWPYELDVYDPKTGSQVQTLPEEAYPTNVEVDTFGNVVGGIDPATIKKDTFVFDQKGFPRGQVKKFGIQWPGATKISGDSTRFATITGGPTVVLRNMP